LPRRNALRQARYANRRCAARLKKEVVMKSGETCLHRLVDKWLAPATVLNVHVVRSGRMPAQRARFVFIEAVTPSGTRGMFFFRHQDGGWRVFPPHDVRPSLCVDALAA
jgi:hypothetical protein